MPRHLCVEYSGAIYHVMNRGNQHADIFKDDQDRQRFLETLGETWEVYLERSGPFSRP